MAKHKTYKIILFLLVSLFIVIALTAFFAFNNKTNLREYTAEDFYNFKNAVMAIDDNLDNSDNLSSREFYDAKNKEYSTFYLKRLITVGEIDNTYGASKVVDGYKDISFLCYDSEEQTEYAYSKLSQNDDILVIIDQIISIADYSDNTYPNNFNWGYSAINAGGINDYLNTFGTDEEVVVAVLDTGINTSHEILQDRILTDNGQLVGDSYFETEQTYSGYNFEDDHGHGSHVSGIITSSTPDNVKILPIKVLNVLGSGDFRSVILALESLKVVYSNYNICSINLSLGGASDVYTLTQLDSWFETLRDEQNILTVVAAGNEQLDTANYMPANSENVITVSALKQSGNDYVFDDSYSNFGESVDISAPGTLVASAYYANNPQGYDYVLMSGTSMAAPHVSAAIALLCSDINYWNGNTPTYTADIIETRLYQNTTDLGEPGKDKFYGYGMLDLKYFNVLNNQDVLSFEDNAGNVVSTETYTEFTNTFTLSVSSSVSGYRIFYTTDGSTPDKNSHEYTAPLNITNSVTYKFIALYIENENTVASSIIYTVELFNPNDEQSDFFVIDINNVVIEYTGHFKDVVIPDIIDGRVVKELGNFLFKQNNVETVTLPDSCQIINPYCFSNCEQLTEVNFNNVYYIGAFAFENCSSLSLINLDSVTQLAPKEEDYDINGHVFDGCLTLKEIYLPDIEMMGANNFQSTTVESVYVGPSLNTFYGRSIDSNITVYGYKNSLAEEYCDSYGNTFIALDELEIVVDLQPTKVVTQYSNENLSITASGFMLSYQWYKTESTISNGVALVGETSSTLELDTNSLGEAKYFVQVFAFGEKSLYSNICSVSVENFDGYTAQFHNGASWEYFQSLNEAIEESSSGAVVVLSADCYLTEPLSIEKNITFVAINDATLYIASILESKNALININGNLNLGLEDTTYQGLTLTNLNIDGQNNSFNTLFSLQNGSILNIQAGAKVQNFTLNNLIAENGRASFNMQGGTITNINKNSSGGLIDVSSVILAGGTISNCTATNGELFDVTDGQLEINKITITRNNFKYIIVSYYDGEVTITGGGFGNNTCDAIILFNVVDYINSSYVENSLKLYGGVSLGNNSSGGNYYYDVIISDRGNGNILENCVELSSGCQFTEYYIDNSNSSFKINMINGLYDSLVLNINFYNYRAYLDESHPIFTLDNSSTINTEHLHGDGYNFISDGNIVYLKDTTVYHLYFIIPGQQTITQDYYYMDYINYITAPTITGYDFLGWYQNQEYTIPFDFETMPAENIYAYAKYEVSTFLIYATYGENGNISPSGEVEIKYGQSQLYTIEAEQGYHVSLIEIDGTSLTGDEFDVAVAEGYTFENVTQNHTIYVEFEINNYVVNISCSQYGNVTPSGELTFTYGQSETFILTANDYAHIKAITINGRNVNDDELANIINNGYITLNFITDIENYQIYVDFALDTLTIIASTNGHGTLSPSGNIVLDYGSSKLFTATANAGYYLTKVEVDGVALSEDDMQKFNSDGYLFENITQNHTIYAEFEIYKYIINASTNGNGQISPSGASTYEYGENGDYQITANTGYTIKNILIDNVALFSENQDDITSYTYSFDNIDSNHEIYAEFDKIKFNISINIEGNGTITSLQDRTSAEYGDNRLFTINTDFENYDVEVFVNDVKIETSNNQFTISNIEEDIEIDVRFFKKAFIDTTIGKVVIISICVIAALVIISIPLSKFIRRRRMYRNNI